MFLKNNLFGFHEIQELYEQLSGSVLRNSKAQEINWEFIQKQIILVTVLSWEETPWPQQLWQKKAFHWSLLTVPEA